MKLETQIETEKLITPADVKNILTFEVEDTFHLDGPHVDSDGFRSRIIPIIIHLLDTLDDVKAKATFFILGQVAEKFPEVAVLLETRDHEVASHDYCHRDIKEIPRDRIISELKHSKKILDDILEEPVIGYKSTSEFIERGQFWLLEELTDLGYMYDCSIVSGALDDRYNKPIRIGLRNGKEIIELPQTVYKKFGVPLRIGERLRHYPWWITNRAISELNRSSVPVMINMKLWELDLFQSKPVNAEYTQYSRYGNLYHAEKKLLRLLDMYEFTSCKKAIELSGI